MYDAASDMCNRYYDINEQINHLYNLIMEDIGTWKA